MLKKIIVSALFLLMPLSCYASVTDIEEIKNKLDLPTYYVQTSQNAELDENSSYTNVSWSGEKDGKGGTVSVRVDSLGRIIYYNGYEYGNFEGDFHLSSFDSKEASKLALSQLKNICPEFAFEVVDKVDDEYILRTSEYYNIKFIRYVNNIPYYSNYITASIHAGTGKLTEFSVVWDNIDKDDFPKPAAILKADKAKEAYKKNIEITLGNTKDASGEYVLQYFPNVTGATFISAYTGEALKTGTKSGKYGFDTSLFVKAPDGLDRNVIAYTNGTEFSKKEGYVRELLKISDLYILNSVAIMENGIGQKYLLFYFENGDEYINAEISFLTNELTLYQRGFSQTKHYSGISKANARTKAVAFFKNVNFSKYKMCSEPITYDGYTYLFRRILEDGISYTDNGVAVTVDAVTGDVSSYLCSWDYYEINRKPKIKDINTAYNNLFKKGEYSLLYVAKAKNSKKIANTTNDIEISLVYGFNPEIPQFIDAYSGEIVYSDNTPYFKKTGKIFSDIENHPSKEHILRLSKAGIIPKEEHFKPNEPITQLEYFSLLFKAFNLGDTVDMYNKLVYEYGALDENEVLPMSHIEFEIAVKYAVRLLGYREVAELENVYRAPFVDEASISPELIGYAAIAKGLGIVNGNAFVPKQTVTRAIAAEIIYNAVSMAK